MKCDRDGFYCQKRRAVRETRYLELGPFPIIIARLSGLIAALIWRLSALRDPPPVRDRVFAPRAFETATPAAIPQTFASEPSRVPFLFLPPRSERDGDP